MIRFNTDTGFCEFYNGTIWQNFGTGGNVNYTVDNFTGNGVQTVFTMTVAESDEQQIIVFVGSIYQDPATAYTVNGGFDITFTSAPPNTVPISVIHSQN
jgi:stress response protein SCP2